MVRTRVRNDLIPDNSLVCRVVGARPLGGDVDEELLGVPCEERGEVGVEGELDDGVFFLFGAVVMGTTLDSAALPLASGLLGGWRRRGTSYT